MRYCHGVAGYIYEALQIIFKLSCYSERIKKGSAPKFEISLIMRFSKLILSKDTYFHLSSKIPPLLNTFSTFHQHSIFSSFIYINLVSLKKRKERNWNFRRNRKSVTANRAWFHLLLCELVNAHFTTWATQAFTVLFVTSVLHKKLDSKHMSLTSF